MKKVKYNEVPNEYRRNYKKEAIELLGILTVCSCMVLILIWMFWIA